MKLETVYIPKMLAEYVTPCTARLSAPIAAATALKKGGPVDSPTFPAERVPRAKMMVTGLQGALLTISFWVVELKSALLKREEKGKAEARGRATSKAEVENFMIEMREEIKLQLRLTEIGTWRERRSTRTVEVDCFKLGWAGDGYTYSRSLITVGN